jgi:hypothetical protein
MKTEKDGPLYIADSLLGFGAFASRNINRGEIIHKLSGREISFSESVAMGKDQSFSLQVSKNTYIFLDAPGKFINHSCEPNCGLKPDLSLVALRDIRRDEQFFYDYSTTMLERHWQMRCECQTLSCRGLVRDFDLLPEELQKTYLRLGIVMPFIIEMTGKEPEKPAGRKGKVPDTNHDQHAVNRIL